MEKINNKYLNEIMVFLMEKDKELTFDVMAIELAVSKREISKVKQGKDLPIRYYIAIISFLLDSIRLAVNMRILVRALRKVVVDEEDLLIATVPRKKGKASTPEHWNVLMEWDRN